MTIRCDDSAMSGTITRIVAKSTTPPAMTSSRWLAFIQTRGGTSSAAEKLGGGMGIPNADGCSSTEAGGGGAGRG